MKLSDFDYNLPEELIAQYPADRRDESRLLVLDRKSGKIEHTVFKEIINYLCPSDLLVLNNTLVFPARLIGRKKKTGGKVEVFLLKEISKNKWEILTKYKGGKIPHAPPLLKGDKEGLEVLFGEGELECKLSKNEAIFECNGDIYKMLDKHGKVPLPPYKKRNPPTPPFRKGGQEGFDRERYQTVYAEKRGAVAAPTAGLHFTKELLADIEKKGVETAKVTLHVGYGTFKPVKSENFKEHKIDPEYYEIKESEAKKINNAVKSERRIIAVGTTTVRTLESAVNPPFNKGGRGGIKAQCGYTDIFIYNGFNFKITNALLTNFHLPKSTLLMLVCAFAGRDMVLYAYNEAIKEGYRFYSYGDAMLII